MQENKNENKKYNPARREQTTESKELLIINSIEAVDQGCHYGMLKEIMVNLAFLFTFFDTNVKFDRTKCEHLVAPKLN